jgi:hypothetical protein
MKKWKEINHEGQNRNNNQKKKKKEQKEIKEEKKTIKIKIKKNKEKLPGKPLLDLSNDCLNGITVIAHEIVQELELA